MGIVDKRKSEYVSWLKENDEGKEASSYLLALTSLDSYLRLKKAIFIPLFSFSDPNALKKIREALIWGKDYKSFRAQENKQFAQTLKAFNSYINYLVFVESQKNKQNSNPSPQKAYIRGRQYYSGKKPDDKSFDNTQKDTASRNKSRLDKSQTSSIQKTSSTSTNSKGNTVDRIIIRTSSTLDDSISVPQVKSNSRNITVSALPEKPSIKFKKASNSEENEGVFYKKLNAVFSRNEYRETVAKNIWYDTFGKYGFGQFKEEYMTNLGFIKIGNKYVRQSKLAKQDISNEGTKKNANGSKSEKPFVSKGNDRLFRKQLENVYVKEKYTVEEAQKVWKDIFEERGYGPFYDDYLLGIGFKSFFGYFYKEKKTEQKQKDESLSYLSSSYQSRTTNDDFYLKLKSVFTKEIYSSKEVEQLWHNNFTESEHTFFRKNYLLQIGYEKEYGWYYLKRFGNLEAGFKAFLSKKELFDFRTFDSDLTSNWVFDLALKHLKEEYQVIEYERDKYISLERVGKETPWFKGKKTLTDYCVKVSHFIKQEKIDIFTVHYLKERGFKHSIDELGFDEWFYSSILAQSKEGFSCSIVSGNRLFCKADRNVRLNDLISVILKNTSSKTMDIYDLENVLRKEYALSNVSIGGIKRSLKDTTIFYDDVSEKCFLSYNIYFDSI